MSEASGSKRNTHWRRTAVLGSALLAAALLPGCGGGGNNPMQHTPVRSVVTQQNWTLEAIDLGFVDVGITGTGTGTMDVVVQWTYASNDVDVAVTAVSCTVDQFIVDLCTILASADSTTTKPERVTLTVSSGNSYRIWIVNWGPTAESGTIEVGLTQ